MTVEILPSTPRIATTEIDYIRPGTRVRWHDKRIHHGRVIQNWRRDSSLHVVEDNGPERALDPNTVAIFNLGRNCQTPGAAS